MNETQLQLLIVLGSYIGVFFGTLIIMQVMSKGILFKFITVKARRKNRILMFIRGVTGSYTRVGKIKESKLHWTSAGGDKCSAPLDYEFVTDFSGVPNLEYDEVNNVFIKHIKGEEVQTGLDPAKVDIMVERAYLLGQLQNTKTMLVILIILAVVGFLTIASVFLSYKNFKALQMLTEQVATIRNAVAPVVVMP
jgi:hypothetical protein